MLKTRNLGVFAGKTKIIKDVSLEVEEGEVALLVGPNGSGKSTFAKALMGDPRLKTKGKVLLNGKNISNLPPHERAKLGMFLSFQNPPGIEGVRTDYFLNSFADVDEGKLGKISRRLDLREDIFSEDLHSKFSGGEKKKIELIQSIVADPEVLIFDEIDSGMDVDSLKTVGEFVSRLKKEGKTILIITHHTRAFLGIQPDRVYVMVDGRIIQEDGPGILSELDKHGFGRWKDET